LWFTISNPPFWLLLGFGGLVMLIVEMLRRPATFIFNTPQRNQLLYVACFVAPVFAVIVMKSVLYDDWRHLYFVLPSFLLIAIYLVHRLHGKMKKVVYAMCMVQVAFVGIDMVTNHPFHQVYFNSLVSHKEEFLRKNYELDYWGCSYKQALDYLIAQDHYGWIKVYSPNKGFACLDNNILMLQQGDQKRIFDVDSVAADYMITNFRWHPADYKVGKLVYSIKVNNSTIMAVYKLK
jgi:hypothetical protein